MSPLADIVIPLDYIPSLFMQLPMEQVPEDDALIAAPTYAALFNPCTPSPRYRDSCVWWGTKVLGMGIVSITTTKLHDGSGRSDNTLFICTNRIVALVFNVWTVVPAWIFYLL